MRYYGYLDCSSNLQYPLGNISVVINIFSILVFCIFL